MKEIKKKNQGVMQRGEKIQSSGDGNVADESEIKKSARLLF